MSNRRCTPFLVRVPDTRPNLQLNLLSFQLKHIIIQNRHLSKPNQTRSIKKVQKKVTYHVQTFIMPISLNTLVRVKLPFLIRIIAVTFVYLDFSPVLFPRVNTTTFSRPTPEMPHLTHSKSSRTT